MLTEQRLEALLEDFTKVKIALVGDFFLDKYLDCDRMLSEVSLETGLEAFQVVRVRCYPGAAGTVANNLKALKVGTVYAVGFTGDDGEGYELRRGLEKIGVDLTYLEIRPDLMTPTYTKPMMREPDGKWHELNRLDIKNRKPLPEDLQERVIQSVQQLLPQVHAVVVSDQVQERNCGIITDKVQNALNELAAAHPDKVFYADSRERIGEFSNFTMKPNRYEAAKAVHGEWHGSVSVEQAVEFGKALFERNRKPVFITAGEQGILVFCEDGSFHIPAVPVEGEIDIVGAGDSVTGGIVPSLCLGAHPVEAATIGNIVASITIQQIGVTGTATPEQVMERFRQVAGKVTPRLLSS